MSNLKLASSSPSEAEPAETTSPSPPAVPTAGHPPSTPVATPAIQTPPPPPAGTPAPPPPPFTQSAQPVKQYNKGKNSGSRGLVIGLVIGLVVLLGIVGAVAWMVSQGGFSIGGLSAGGKAESLSQEELDAMATAKIADMYDRAYTVEWPAIVLSGMVAGTEEETRSAILNGELIATHQTIEQVRLVEVTSDGVVLEYRNSRKLIRIGEST